jgi:excisionase family DNA binding protein
MNKVNQLQRASNSILPIYHLIQKDIKGELNKEEGDRIIKQMIELMKPNSPDEVSEILSKLKYSLSNVFETLINSVITFQLNLSESNELVESPSIDERIDGYLTIKEVCKMMNVSRPTLDVWKKKGLRCIKIGGRVYVTRADLNDYIRNNQI